MSNVTRQTAPDRLRKLAADLTAVGIQPPAEITDALARLEQIETRRPEPVETADLIDAYVRQATDKQLTERLLSNIGHAALSEAWREARIKTAQEALAALPSHGDDLTRELAALAVPLIATVTQTARIDTHDLQALMRAQRVDEAHLVTAYPTRCAELQNLYRLRDRVTKGADYGNDPALARAAGYTGASCAVWRDPRAVRNQGANVGWEVWRDSIRAGGELWFPLPDEAAAQARKIVAEVRAAEQRQEAENARHSFGTGMGSRVATR